MTGLTGLALGLFVMLSLVIRGTALDKPEITPKT